MFIWNVIATMRQYDLRDVIRVGIANIGINDPAKAHGRKRTDILFAVGAAPHCVARLSAGVPVIGVVSFAGGCYDRRSRSL